MKSFFSHSPTGLAATMALISFGYFVIAVVALYFLNPSYSLSASIYGSYDLGSYEFLIASTFFALGIGSLALGVGLAEAMLPSLRSWFGRLLLGIWGVGIFLAGIFPANDGGSTVPHMTTVLIAGIFPVRVQATPETAYSFVHIFIILGSCIVLTIASVLLSTKLRQDERWPGFSSLLLLLALLMLVLALFFIPTFLYPSLLGYTTFNSGLFVLIGIHIGILWLLFVAAWLRFAVNGSIARS